MVTIITTNFGECEKIVCKTGLEVQISIEI